MRRQLLAAFGMLLLCTVLTGILYPLVITGIGQAAFAGQANGSLIYRQDQPVGSRLIGQPASGAGYFHPRPSGIDYDGADSGGRNLGPTNPELLADIDAAAAAYRARNGLAPDAEVPVDAVTESASGLDPDISLANARLQAPRVASARGMDVGEVTALIEEHARHRVLGSFGEPTVNVLNLNLALGAR